MRKFPDLFAIGLLHMNVFEYACSVQRVLRKSQVYYSMTVLINAQVTWVRNRGASVNTKSHLVFPPDM